MDSVLTSDRYLVNKQILKVLDDLVEKYPDQRFQQLLQNTDITDMSGEDKFYEESTQTYLKLMHSKLIKH